MPRSGSIHIADVPCLHRSPAAGALAEGYANFRSSPRGSPHALACLLLPQVSLLRPLAGVSGAAAPPHHPPDGCSHLLPTPSSLPAPPGPSSEGSSWALGLHPMWGTCTCHPLGNSRLPQAHAQNGSPSLPCAISPRPRSSTTASPRRVLNGAAQGVQPRRDALRMSPWLHLVLFSTWVPFFLVS